MIDFIVQNWRLVVEVVLVFISFVFFIIKKKPIEVVDNFHSIITNTLLELIKSAERTSLTGEQKKEYCLSQLISLCRKDGFNLNKRDIDFAADQIEYILSCPQKKGK